MTDVHGLLLCAGQGLRMGGPNKLLLPFGNSTVLETTVSRLKGSGLNSLWAVTGHEPQKIQAVLKKNQISIVHNPHYKNGFHSSIRTGLASLPESGFVAICLADQPMIDLIHYQVLIAEARRHPEALLIAPVFLGKRGNPALINLKLKPVILSHPDNDKGCAYLFNDYPDDVILVPMESDSVLQDLDSPEDYQCLKTSTSSSRS